MQFICLFNHFDKIFYFVCVIYFEHLFMVRDSVWSWYI